MFVCLMVQNVKNDLTNIREACSLIDDSVGKWPLQTNLYSVVKKYEDENIGYLMYSSW